MIRRLQSMKDLLWAAGIGLCLLALFIGLVSSCFTSFYGDREVPAMNLRSGIEERQARRAERKAQKEAEEAAQAQTLSATGGDTIVIVGEPGSTLITEPGSPDPTAQPTACPHPSWNDGVCTACGAVCGHPSHDAQTLICSVCGSKVPHSYENFVCALCGSGAVLDAQGIPRALFDTCAHRGTVETLSYTTADYRKSSDGSTGTITKQMSVYLPYGYSSAEKYDVLILMHGAGGSENYWLVEAQDYDSQRGGKVYTRDLLDQMMDQGLCRKMIVAAPTFYRDSEQSYDYNRGVDEAAFVKELRTSILPAIVEHYSTWAGAPTEEAISAARRHFAYAGLSMSSMYAYHSVMSDCLDLFSSFGCFSGADGDMDVLAASLNSGPSVDVFYNSIGSLDTLYNAHRNLYQELLKRTDALKEGQNAALTVLDNQRHVYAAWSTGLYNFLPLLFPQ